MKSLLLSFLIFNLLIFNLACYQKNEALTNMGEIVDSIPKSLNLIKLDDTVSTKNEQQIIYNVDQYLKGINEIPSQFYYKIKPPFGLGEEKDEKIITIELWHENHFLEKNVRVRGNPSGKSRTLIINEVTGKVISDKLWQ